MKLRRLVTLAALLIAVPCRADTDADAGRRIWKGARNAVVAVRLVMDIRTSFNGQERRAESRTETTGTVVDPSGLTVISLSAADPTDITKSRLPPDAPEIQMEAGVRTVDLVLNDGTEVPAQIVLRDKDIDAAFILPLHDPSPPFPAVDLSRSAKPDRLEQTVCLNRMGRIAGGAAVVSLERISGLVERPRPFYLLAPGGSSGIGSPVFSLSGKAIGIILLRNLPPDGNPNLTSLFAAGGGTGLLPVVIPAADIHRDVSQALAAK